MNLFIVRIKGIKEPVKIVARTKKEAAIKAIQIEKSRDFMISNPMLRPGTLKTARRIF